MNLGNLGATGMELHPQIYTSHEKGVCGRFEAQLLPKSTGMPRSRWYERPVRFDGPFLSSGTDLRWRVANG